MILSKCHQLQHYIFIRYSIQIADSMVSKYKTAQKDAGHCNENYNECHNATSVLETHYHINIAWDTVAGAFIL